MSSTMNDRLAGRLPGDECGANWVLEPEIECASAAEIKVLSDEAWQRHAADLQDRSPFHARKYRSEGHDLARMTLDDLAGVPFTTKAELKANQEEIPPFGDYLGVSASEVKRVYQTSGTTGSPSLLALTGYDLKHVWGRIARRTYYATGLHPHHRVLATFAAGPFVAGLTHGVLEDLRVCTVPVAPGDTARALSALERGLVDTMLGTPTFAIYLSNVLEERGLDAREAGLRHILSGGEPGGGIPVIRRRIEEAFDATVTEVMGLGDVSPSIYSECPEGGGMHFGAMGLVWVELLAPGTDEVIPIEPGAVGEPVYTSLVREAMPVVRFRSGDIVEVQDGDCACGRTSWRMRCIGRADDMFIVRGVNVYPSAVQAVIAEFRPAVTGRARVVLPHGRVSVDPPVPVEVEVSSSGDPAVARRIEETIRARLTFRSEVRFVPAAEFGDAGYKTRAVVRTGPDA
jgi:phenylacetate-CoA ligase